MAGCAPLSRPTRAGASNSQGSPNLTADQLDQIKSDAKRIREKSTSGHELCSPVCIDGNGKVLVNEHDDGSNIACAPGSSCPTGSTYSGYSIHAHGNGKPFTVNKADENLTRNFEAPFEAGTRVPGGNVLNDFSEQDYRHPGFLVGSDHLYFQSGLGTAVDLGSFDNEKR